MISNVKPANQKANLNRRRHSFNKTISYIKSNYWLYLLLIPGLAYFIIFSYVPMYGVSIAFRDFSVFKGFSDAPFVGLKNFEELFRQAGFLRALRNNFIISIEKLIFGFPAPIILSLLINEINNRHFKKIIQTSVILPHFVSWIVISGLLFAIFSVNSGAIKGLVNVLGYKGEIPNVLTDKNTFRIVIVASDIWKNMGMGTIIYLAAITSIDPNLYEAAIIDGAGKWAQTWHVTLPSIRSLVVIMLIFRAGSIMDAGFDQIFAISNYLVISVADIIDTYVYKLGIVQMDYSVASAAGLFKSLVGATLILITNYIAKKIDDESGVF